MPDPIIDAAVARMEQANRRQRRIEAAAVIVVLGAVIIFQVVNPRSLHHAEQRSDRAAVARSAALGRKLDDANARIGQLEGALAAAGLKIPERAPEPTAAAPRSQPGSTTPGSTTPPSTSARLEPSPPPSSPSSTTTTTMQRPTTSTTACLVGVAGTGLICR